MTGFHQGAALFGFLNPIFVNDSLKYFIMRRILWLGLILLTVSARAQKTDFRLQKQIEELVAGFHGSAGVYVHDLKKNRIAAVNADSLFPTASVVKIPILIGIMNRIGRQELEYNQVMIYKDTLNYDHGED